MLLYMANKARRGKTKPWGDGIKYPGPDYLPSEQLPDLRLEQFAILIARNASRRRAVLTAFPNAAATATAYRAANLLGHPGILARVQWLRRQTADYLAGKVSGLIVDVPRDGTATKQDQEQERDARIREAKQCLSDQTFLEESKKSRDPKPADLTPAELRLIISEGARAGNAAAINAAIKMLDASLSAPPTLVDPAAVCAVLFNGGGGGETLNRIILRLFDVFGAQAVMDCVSHNISYVSLNQSQGVATQPDMKRDNVAQCGADSVQGGGVGGDAGRGADQEHEDNTRAAQAGGGDGEGGEVGGGWRIGICSENFTTKNATKPTNTPLAPPAADES